jgi:thiamine biosynthesis lipoprotein
MLCLAVAFFSGCGGEYTSIKESRIVMGTVVEITVAHPDGEHARAAMEAAFSEFERIDRLLSGYEEASEVTRINREGRLAEVEVGGELLRLLKKSLEISRLSDGAFDVTIGPVMKLWNFDEGGTVPSSAEVAAVLASVGFDKVSLNAERRTVRLLAEGGAIDMGGIGKGYAVDLAAARLREKGVDNAIIDAGGDLKLLGRKPGKDFWRIGVRHPRDAARLLVSLDLAETAVVTSGDYERFFVAEERRYHHLLDPRTGYPASSCQSATVIAPDAVDADAYATAVFVLGPEKGMALLRSLPGVEGIVVDSDGKVLWSDEAALKR